MNSAIGLAADVNLLSRPIEQAMKRFALPTAFIHGTSDPYTGTAEIERYASLVGQATIEHIDKCGHYASASRPAAFWGAVAKQLHYTKGG